MSKNMPLIHINLISIDLGDFSKRVGEFGFLLIQPSTTPYQQCEKLIIDKYHLPNINHIWTLYENEKDMPLSKNDKDKNWNENKESQQKSSDRKLQTINLTIKKHKLWKDDVMFGWMSIPLRQLPMNKVVKHTFNVHSSIEKTDGLKVTLEIHRSNKGMFPFSAPLGKMNIIPSSITKSEKEFKNKISEKKVIPRVINPHRSMVPADVVGKKHERRVSLL